MSAKSLKSKYLRNVSVKNSARHNRHVHEFLGSTKLAGVILHNHRFAGVSSRAIKFGKTHVHAVIANTDFTVQHLHRIKAISGLPIPVGRSRHVHFVRGRTSFDREHDHAFVFATLIENPLGL